MYLQSSGLGSLCLNSICFLVWLIMSNLLHPKLILTLGTSDFACENHMGEKRNHSRHNKIKGQGLRQIIQVFECFISSSSYVSRVNACSIYLNGTGLVQSLFLM